MKQTTIVAIIMSGALAIGAVILAQEQTPASTGVPAGTNVTVENGKQIVAITAKGGYLPTVSTAKAGIPTTLRMTTNGTFDCSSALALPAINYQKNLPASGVTDIELPPQPAGSTFKGLCSMGMQRFEIAFK